MIALVFVYDKYIIERNGKKKSAKKHNLFYV